MGREAGTHPKCVHTPSDEKENVSAALADKIASVKKQRSKKGVPKIYKDKVPQGTSIKSIKEAVFFVRLYIFKGMKFGRVSELMGPNRENLMVHTAARLGVHAPKEPGKTQRREQVLHMARSFALTVVRRTQNLRTAGLVRVIAGKWMPQTKSRSPVECCKSYLTSCCNCTCTQTTFCLCTTTTHPTTCTR